MNSCMKSIKNTQHPLPKQATLEFKNKEATTIKAKIQQLLPFCNTMGFIYNQSFEAAAVGVIGEYLSPPLSCQK